MGLFDKRSAEEKAFDKAFKAAVSKPGPKTFPALEAACQKYTPGWKGWLLMGLCYDCGAGVARDAEKAAACHQKAKDSGEDWPETFYYYYDRSAGNIYMDDLCDRALACRRMGVAAMACLDVAQNDLLDSLLENDFNFFWGIFSKVDVGGMFRSSAEQKQVDCHKTPFQTWHAAVNAVRKNKDDEEVQRLRNKDFWKNINRLQKMSSDSITSSDCDTWLFIGALSLLFAGSYGCYAFDFTDHDKNNNKTAAFRLLWNAADIGNVSAMLFLAMFAEDDSTRDLVMENSTHSDSLVTLEALLSLAAERGHAGAQECADDLMQVMVKLM